MRTSLDLRDDVKLLTYIYNLIRNYTTKETAPQKRGIPISLELISYGKLMSQGPKARELMSFNHLIYVFCLYHLFVSFLLF